MTLTTLKMAEQGNSGDLESIFLELMGSSIRQFVAEAEKEDKGGH